MKFLTVRTLRRRVRKLYGTVKIPETYVIDSKGILRRKFVSAQNWTSPEIMDYLGKAVKQASGLVKSGYDSA